MFSADEPSEVLGDLGDKVVASIAASTDGARADLAEFRAWKPQWLPTLTQRFTANLIHERIWARLLVELAPLNGDGVMLIDQEPTREVCVTLDSGRTYRLRLKRHSERNRVRSYPTRSDLAFWGAPAAAPTLDGMEEIRLAAGYRWDDETREIGATVISYREGKSNPIWAVEVAAGAAAQPITWAPVSGPNLPIVDLERSLQVIDDDSEDATGS